MRRLIPVLALIAVVLTGCLPATATPSANPTATPYAGPTGRTRPLDETTGFPRRVETPRGVVTIQSKPQRIHTLSVGFDEITFQLVDAGRIVAVGTSTANPDFSNVADRVGQIARVSRNAEQVIAVRPDLVVAPPTANADLLRALEGAGLTVVVADLLNSVDAQEPNIRLLAYLYGEDERGEQLVNDVRARLGAIDAVVSRKSESQKPRVLVIEPNTNTAGTGTTEDGIVRRAGGINVAAEAGISGNKQISVEAIPGMRPDLIVLVEADSAKPVLQQQIVANPALAEMTAIRDSRTYPVPQRFLTTLSHWNVRGVEELARILYPGDFR